MKNLIGHWFPTVADYPEGRLLSLDVLRGLDMLLLIVVSRLVRATQKGWDCFSPGFMRQFAHGWEGFTLWDIIMPLFIFMCGAAIPFALGRRLKEGPLAYWRHVFGRVLLLWFLGCLLQGNLAELDLMKFTPYSNTLQAIAVGYLATAAMMYVPSRAFAFALPVFLAVAYAVLLAVGGGYGQWDNFAFRVDHAILRTLLPEGNPFTLAAPPNHYTWFLTSLMFASMTMCGYHATCILRRDGLPWRKAVALFALGGILLALGWGVSPWVPVIKPIFTLSFTAQAMGWCVLALAVLYVLTDILKLRKGLSLVLLYGQNALAVYFIAGFFGGAIQSVVMSCCSGMIRLCGAAGPLVQAVAFCCVLTAIVAVWRRLKQGRR